MNTTDAMTSTDQHSSLNTLQASIDAVTGVIMRHGPDAVTRTFVGVAAHLANGDWACMADGVFGGRVYDEFTGTQELIDLWIHPITGGEFPVEWGHKSFLRPLAILHAPNSCSATADLASAAELTYPEFGKVWRNSFGGAQVFADNDFDPTLPTVVIEGCVHFRPSLANWDSSQDDRTPAVLASLDYPGRKDAGGPVIDARGRLAGMLLGPEYGPGSSGNGWYMPVDYIMPSLQMARAAVPFSKGQLGAAVHYVQHRSHDVEF